MSTNIVKKTNKCYSIETMRFYGGKENGVMCSITICDSCNYTSIALTKKEVIDLCAKTIESLNEVG